MKVTIHHGTEKKKVLKEVITVVEEVQDVPVAVGEARLYQVQMRNYPHNNIHVQHAGTKKNRDYGFAFDTKGQVDEGRAERRLLSLAGTGKLYFPGALLVNGASAFLVGEKEQHEIPLSALPAGV